MRPIWTGPLGRQELGQSGSQCTCVFTASTTSSATRPIIRCVGQTTYARKGSWLGPQRLKPPARDCTGVATARDRDESWTLMSVMTD